MNTAPPQPGRCARPRTLAAVAATAASALAGCANSEEVPTAPEPGPQPTPTA